MYYEMAEDAKSGEPDTKEAEALAAALNHSAERVQTLWFSFLTFMVYLAIATGTTTHRMLFLEEPAQSAGAQYQLAAFGLLYSHADHFRRLPFLYAAEPRASRPHGEEF